MGTKESTEFEIDTETIIGGEVAAIEQEFEIVIGQSDPALFELEFEWALGGKPNDNATGSETNSETSGSEEEDEF